MSQHNVSKGTYYAIFFALLVLTGTTVGAAFANLGAFNDIVAMGIACTKATLVVLFFMHVKYGSRLVWAVVSGAIVFLAILFIFILSDYLTRGMIVDPQPW
jgi:cytochrome c oxidase subunit 4